MTPTEPPELTRDAMVSFAAPTGLGGDTCNHKFMCSRHCLKCGWEPPARSVSEQTEYETLRKEMELCELGDRPPSPAAAKLKRIIELAMLSPPNAPGE